MTDTKTKPDGWVWRDWREFFASGLEQMFISATESQIRDTPVCLVPPALLDWVEEVEEKILESLRKDFAWHETAERLLNKLKEVRK